MNSVRSRAVPARISVENIGGIDETTVTLTPGVTVLEGRNATNRTSFLQAIMAALGSDRVSLKADADEGYAEIELGEETYFQRLQRRGASIVTEGDPYLDDPELADLFAFLLESNEARRAVARGDDLRELIMRPVDTEAINDEIDRLEERKREIDAELERLGSLTQRLPELEGKRQDVQERIEQKREELAAKEQEIADFDASVDESRAERQELTEKLEELKAARSDLEDARFDIETQQESIEALREERAELEADREELPEAPVGDIDDIEGRIDDLRERKQEITAAANELQTIIQFNEEMLEGTGSREVVEALRDDAGTADDGAITDQLLADEERVVCWTCGSEIDSGDVEATIDRLRSLWREKLDERDDLDDRIDELENEQIELKEKERQRRQVNRRLDDVEDELERREENVERLRRRRSELESEVDDLESEVDDLESDEQSEIIELHREANRIEFQLGRLQNELDDVEEEIDAIESQVDERERLERTREEITDELADLRTRIDNLEAEAVEQFNEHMETVLDLLDYTNLERIWIERRETETREGRRKVQRQTFDLHVVRTSESGATYEDTVDHLSESEREVTGLVFALAGYLVHEVYETVPFMLLDSLEAIDSERIAQLVEYLGDNAEFLVVALLPEDARALDDAHERVTEI